MSEPGSTVKPQQRLLIVDAHAYAYRAFHAIRHLNSPTGAPTNAIYGFIRMIEKMRQNVAPACAVAVWDGGLSEARVNACPEYKVQRPPMPADLERQIPGMQSYLEASGVCSWQRPGVEADDWIASIARAAAESLEVVIASSDKDFLQLVGPGVGLLNPNDKTEKLWTAADVRAKTGVEPSQVVDWLSLVGDSVDNITGVPGVGPARAAELLQRFGSIDQLYARLDEVASEKLRQVLRETEATVRRNQHLIRLHDVAPAFQSLKELEVRPPDAGRLAVLYREWGFKSLLAQLPAPESAQGQLL
jgi:DNA polymerase-1